jgi:hypothetical protein
MKKVLLALMFVIVPLTLHAQSVVGQFSSCGVLDAGNNYIMSSNAAIPAKSLVIVTVAVDTQTTGNTVADNQGGTNNYNASVVAGFFGTNNVIEFTRYVVGGLPSGTTFTWHQDNGATHKACMNIAAFSSMVAQSFATTNGTGGAAPTSTAPSATTNSPPAAVPNLVFMATSFLSDPGTVSGAGVTLLNKNCILTFCIQPSYKISASPAAQTITLSTTNSTAWTTGIAEYTVNDTIFADGFE